MTLREWTAKITPPDAAAMEEARRRQAQLAKPPGSLGRLEDLSVQLAGITGRVHNKIEKKHLLPPTTALWTRAFRARRAP
mgnify:CR=1 FL=1